ncbi:MAG: FoF1 ATP synthase subunit gamma, partial [Bacteroidota bacterium]
MPNIKEVVSRIQSVTATQQITKAMKMVAAARLNKVQQQVLTMRPYAAKLSAILDNVTASTSKHFAQQYVEDRPVAKCLLVVMSSDRGLCGSSNANVFKKALSYLQQAGYTTPSPQVDLLPIGKKAQAFFAKRNFQLVDDHVALSHHLSFEHVGPVAATLTAAFLQRTYDRIVIVYNAFHSAAAQLPQALQWLPIVSTRPQAAHTDATKDY